MTRDYMTAAERLAPHDSKLQRAVRYLRERGIYCLEQPVRRLPAAKRPPTVLDRWLARRSA